MPITPRPKSADRQELLRIRDYIEIPWSDGQGEWHSGNERVVFGHRRLSIIDCSEAGAQSMASPDGKFIVTFNGEIYNYRELRSALQATGGVFRSQSDTEVLLHLYAQKRARRKVTTGFGAVPGPAGFLR